MNMKKFGLLLGLLITTNISYAQTPATSIKNVEKMQFSLKCVRQYTQGNWTLLVTALGKVAYIELIFPGQPTQYFKTDLMITEQYAYIVGQKDYPKNFWKISRLADVVNYKQDTLWREFTCVSVDFSEAELNRLKTETTQYEKDNPPPVKEVKEIIKPKI